MKVKKEKKRVKYVAPPQFSKSDKPAQLLDKEIWLVQLAPGVDVKELDGQKLKLKNNKVLSVNKTTEVLVQKKCKAQVIAKDKNLPVQGLLTVRRKIEIPLQETCTPIPVAQAIPQDLKYRLTR